jgi:hypothetical protein
MVAEGVGWVGSVREKVQGKRYTGFFLPSGAGRKKNKSIAAVRFFVFISSNDSLSLSRCALSFSRFTFAHMQPHVRGLVARNERCALFVEDDTSTLTDGPGGVCRLDNPEEREKSESERRPVDERIAALVCPSQVRKHQGIRGEYDTYGQRYQRAPK